MSSNVGVTKEEVEREQGEHSAGQTGEAGEATEAGETAEAIEAGTSEDVMRRKQELKLDLDVNAPPLMLHNLPTSGMDKEAIIIGWLLSNVS